MRVFADTPFLFVLKGMLKSDRFAYLILACFSHELQSIADPASSILLHLPHPPCSISDHNHKPSTLFLQVSWSASVLSHPTKTLDLADAATTQLNASNLVLRQAALKYE
jgi:hypothetical protein